MKVMYNMYEYKAKVVNVVDGDTMDLEVDLGFRIYHKIRVRLLGINTPEKFGTERELGEICSEYAKRLWLNQEVVIRSEKEETDVNKDSFGRWLINMKFLNATWDFDAISNYNIHGINKLCSNYSEENVRRLKSEV